MSDTTAARWQLSIEASSFQALAVLTLRGRVTRAASDRLRDALARARDQSSRCIVDLTAVDYLSGAGVGVLVEAAGDGGRLVLCGCQEPVRIALDLSGASSALTIVATAQEALRRP